jgi:hypothetical protein
MLALAVRPPLLLEVTDARARGEGFFGGPFEKMVRPTVESFKGMELDLNSRMPVGVRVTGATVRVVSGDLHLSARLAGGGGTE